MLKIAKNGWAVCTSDGFLSQVPPPHPASSSSGTDGGPKILSPPIKNLEKKPWGCWAYPHPNQIWVPPPHFFRYLSLSDWLFSKTSFYVWSISSFYVGIMYRQQVQNFQFFSKIWFQIAIVNIPIIEISMRSALEWTQASLVLVQHFFRYSLELWENFANLLIFFTQNLIIVHVKYY